MTTPDPNEDNAEWTLVDTDLTTVLDILPASEANILLMLNEPGSGNLNIPLDSLAAGRLTSGQFVRFSYRGALRGGFFVENINKTKVNSSEGGENFVSLSGRGALALLDDAIVYPDDNSNATRKFAAKTKAYILKTLIDEAQARGTMPALVYDFTATTDSASTAWTDSEDMEITAGKSLLDVVRDMGTLGIDFDITVNTNGTFTLHAYKNGVGTDKHSTVYFRVGRNCTDLGSSQAGGDLKNVFAVKYDGGFSYVTDSASVTANRRREGGLDSINAYSAEHATSYGQAKLSTSKNPKVETSVSIYDGVNPRIFLDYILGDHVTLDVKGVETSNRLYSLQLKFGENEKANIIVGLNTSLQDINIRQDNSLRLLTEAWRRAHDANLLNVEFWGAIGAPNDNITSVWASAIIGDNLYVSGSWAINSDKIIGGIVPTSGIVRYNITTGQWFTVDTTTGPVYAMKAHGTDLYIGGWFTGETPSKGIHKYNTLTGVTSNLSSGLTYVVGGIAIVWGIEIIGTDLYCVGTFNRADAVTVSNIARWDISGATWYALTGASTYAAVSFQTDIVANGTLLYVSGGLAGGDKASVYDTVGTTWTALNTGLDAVARVFRVYGTTVLAGGAFTGGIAELSGTTWSIFQGGVNNTVYAMAVNGLDVYIGGLFTDVGNYVAKNNGSGWEALQEGTNGVIYNVSLYNNTAVSATTYDLYVFGAFTTAGTKDAINSAVHFDNFNSLMNYVENSGSFDMGAAIHGAPASAITDSDELPFWEGTANALRKITYANFRDTGLSDTVYGAGWDGDTTHAPTKNAVYDKINTLGGIGGSGVVGQVAEFVTNTTTLQAAKIIGPASNILTLTNAAAATLALNITAAKTLTLTATDNYTLTVPASLTAAGLAIANVFTTQQFVDGTSDQVQLRVQAHSSQTANILTIENSSAVAIGGFDKFGRVFSDPQNVGNFFAGGAGTATMTGTGNNAIGAGALASMVSGINNFAFGQSSLANATGSNNTAIGYQALSRETSGADCVGIGTNAGFYNQTGTKNIWIGSTAGQGVVNQSNSRNVGIGYQSGSAITTGSNNVLIGTYSGLALTGSSNIFIGYQSGANQTAISNLFIVDRGIGNVARASAALEQTNSIIYGVMGDTPGAQTLRLNAVTSIILDSATTNAAIPVQYLQSNSTGTVANGFGVQQFFVSETATADTAQNQALIASSWIDATNATRKAKLSLSAYDTAERLGLEIEASGTAAKLGFFGAATVVQPSAYTQTYATASKTNPTATAANLSATASTQVTPWGFASQAQADDIATQVNKMQTDYINLQKLVNSIIDDFQALGLLS